MLTNASLPMTSRMSLTCAAGSEFWNDSCDLEHLGEAIAAGASGATCNPVIVLQTFNRQRDRWLPVLQALARAKPDACEDELVWDLTKQMAVKAATLLRPIHEQSLEQQGKISVQVNPRCYRSTEKMVAQGLELAALAPNIAVKIPAIPAGIAAMEELTARGISINATVSFSVAQAVACAEAVERGLQRSVHSMGYSRAPFVTLMVGRIEDHLRRVIEQNDLVLDPTAIPWSGVAVFKQAYEVFCARGFRARLLAAAYRHSLHWSELIGGGTVLSIPYRYWKMFDGANVNVENTIRQPVADLVLGELKKVDDFERMFRENGMKPDQFLGFGATQHTLEQFLIACDDLTRSVRVALLQGER